MTVHKFAVVVGSDVAGTISIDDSRTEEAVARFVAAYYSDPKIVPLTPEQDSVAFGWTYNDGVFVDPNSGE